MTKRVIAMILAIIMAFSLPVSAFAENVPEQPLPEEEYILEEELAAPEQTLPEEELILDEEPAAPEELPEEALPAEEMPEPPVVEAELPLDSDAPDGENPESAVVRIGEVGYDTLADAVAAAQAGDVIEILAPGTYTLPNLPNNVTVKGAADGVVFDCVGSGSICSIPNGASFERVEFLMGQSNYHGFQHAGTLNFTNCTFEGKFFSYGDMNFNGCEFNQTATDYHMWAYGMNLTYTNCVFNGHGKFINVYNEGNGAYSVSFDGCTFNSDVSNKAAVNVKETCGSTVLGSTVTVTNCTVNENFPKNGPMGTAIVFGNGVVMVDDRLKNETESKGIKVVLNGETIYKTEKDPVAMVGETPYSNLADALNAAVTCGSDVTVTILTDIDLTGTTWTPVSVTNCGVITVEGDNHSIYGLNDMLFGKTWAGRSGLIIKNLAIRDSVIVHDESDTEGDVGVGAFVGYPEASETVSLINCHLVNSTVSGGHWTGGLVGAAAGYNGSDGPVYTTLTINGCSVENCTIKGLGSVGGVIGHATQNAATEVILTNTSVVGSTLVGAKENKTGRVIGTIGAAGTATAFNGKVGGIELNVVESGNTGATNVVGRIGSTGGAMTVTGGSYASDPTVTSDNNIGTLAVAEGYEIRNTNGVYTVQEKEPVAVIGTEKYFSVAEAFAAAKAGDKIEILTAGTYKLPASLPNVTVKGAVDGVVFDCVGSGSICGLGSGASFENVKFLMGQNNYHGFQHAGTLNFKNCTFEGKFFSYGDMNFNGCEFNQTAKDYHMWAYGMNLTYTDCVFNGHGKFINVYNEGNGAYSVSFDGCTFNSDVKNKAAVNVKETCGSTVLGSTVTVTNCTVNENFPKNGPMDTAIVFGNGVVMVDDRLDGFAESAGIKVVLDGETVYETEKALIPDAEGVYHIGNQKDLEKLKTMVNGGNSFAGKTVVLDADINFDGSWSEGIGTQSAKFSGIFDGVNHTVGGLHVEANGFAGFFGGVWNAEIRNLTLVEPVIVNTATDYTGAVAGHGYVRIKNVTVLGGSVTGAEQVGGIIGYLSCGSVTDCTVENTAITATTERAGGIAGKANVDSQYQINGNTVKNAAVSGAQSGGLVGQIMTGADKLWEICDNSILNVTLPADGNIIGNVRSGHLRSDFEDHVLRNYWKPETPTVTMTDGTASVTIRNYYFVAEVNGEKYLTMQAALAAAQNGETVTMLADAYDLGNLSLKENATLNGNGRTIGGNSALYINAEGGTVENVTFANIHNAAGKLSAIYGDKLSGTATVTGCTFNNCDWDAIQITPVAGAVISITGNTFTDDTNDGVTQQRFVHIQSGKNVDFAATVTGNKFFGDTAQGSLEVYYFADDAKVSLSGNYIEYTEDTCILKNDSENVCEMILPLKNETLTENLPVAAIIKDTYSCTFYATLPEAIAAVPANGTETTVILTGDVTGQGIVTKAGQNIVIDFANHTYTVDTTVGSTGTKTNGFQLLKDSKVKLENGTLTSTTAKILIQNYSDLTVENMTLDGTKSADCGYVVSNNNGSFTTMGNNTIEAAEGKNAFDVCLTNNYPDGVTVTVSDGTTVIGKVEYDLWGEKPAENKAILNITGGTFENTEWAVDAGLEEDAKASITVTGGHFDNEAVKQYIPVGYRYDNGTVTKCTEHSFDQEAATEKYLVTGATCTAAAVYVKSCVCGVAGTETFSSGEALGHDYDENGICTRCDAEYPFEAKIGDTKYKTLKEALAAAQNGETVTMLADAYDLGNLSLKENVTLNGDGHTIGGNSALYINAKGGTVENVTFANIHNAAGKLSAIYAEGLTGTATVTGCTFDNCDWDAIQITPKAGAVISITGNTFTDDTADGIREQRFVHVESGKNVDFTATVTGNKFYGDTAQGSLEVYYFTDDAKISLSGNYIKYTEDTCILKNNGENVCEMILPLKNETLTENLSVAAIIKDTYSCAFYATLPEAIAAVPTNGTETTVILADDVTGQGIETKAGQNIVIDFANHTYTVDTTVGSTGTKTNGFQLLKDSKVKLENGTLTSTTAKILIQNYSDLTVENMTLDGTKSADCGYVVSNNNGSFTTKGENTIKAADGKSAFDVCLTNYYPDGVTVTVSDGTTVIGKVEYDLWGAKPAANKAILNITGGTFTDTEWAVDAGLEDDAKASITVTGGHFDNEAVKQYIPVGYALIDGTVLPCPEHVFAYVSNDNGTHTAKCSLCNFEKTENCTYEDETVEPTCTEGGYTVHTCTAEGCSYSFTDTVTDPLGHSWNEGEITTPATHMTEGVKTFTCERCEETKTEPVAKLTAHTFDKEAATEQYLKSAATCTDAAVYYKSCECGEAGTETFTSGEALGHSWDDGKITTPATHMTEGEKTYTCAVCKETKTEPVAKLTAHTFDKEAATEQYLKSAATCTDAAVYYKSCECGEASKTETFTSGEALGHSWNKGEITTPATHMTEGVKTYTCTVCNGTKTEPVAKLTAHTFDKEAATEQYLKSAATCTAAAVYYKSCECGEKGTETFTSGEALGHKWNKGEITTPATHMTEGVKTYTCTVCKETKTEPVAKLTAHTFDKEVATEQYLKSAATCTDAAVYFKSCECGEASKTETFTSGEALGHSWNDGEITTPATHMTEGVKTYTCTVCKETKTEPVAKLTAHTFDKEVASEQYLKSAATCTDAAVYFKSCECGEASKTETFTSGEALGHSWNEGEITKPATYFEDGEKTYTCERCKETKTEPIARIRVHGPIEDFVLRFYSVCLGRDNPGEDEIAYYMWEIIEKGMTGSEVASKFIFADEFHMKYYCDRHYVEALYKTFMGRVPGDDEVGHWVWQLQQGMTREEVFNSFVTSKEFEYFCTEAGIEPGGTVEFTGKGTRAGGRCTVDGCTSAEGYDRFVKRLYNVTLDRDPAQDELDAWVYFLIHGDHTAKTASHEFLFSEEFISYGYEDEVFVDYLYRAMMGRTPGTDEAAYWVWRLSTGMTREEAFNDFANSHEFALICQDYGINCQ